jgi:hypothetical protein
MEAQLRQQVANVADLKHVLKVKSTEHIQAQRETTKILRSTQTLALTRTLTLTLALTLGKTVWQRTELRLKQHKPNMKRTMKPNT